MLFAFASAGFVALFFFHNFFSTSQDFEVPPPPPPLVIPTSHPSKWTTQEVCDWLEAQGLVHLRERFSEHRIRGSALLALTDAVLKEELQLPYGDRVDLMSAITNLKVCT